MIKILKLSVTQKIKSFRDSIKFKIFHNLNNWLLENIQNSFIQGLKSCGKNCYFQMPIHIESPWCVEIGDNVSIAAYVHMWGGGGIKIGNRVMIASHSAITSLTHDYTQEDMSKTLVKGSVTIEDDVWIGAHSVILPGISIGKGAVVGAGSVVTKTIEPYSIVFGSPARFHNFRNIDNIKNN
jgi:acetyltransferase-like isoleucine patch superfamily enzyme